MNAPAKSLALIKQQPLRQVATVKELLWNDEAKQQLATVAARHMNPERMMRLMANAMRTTPKLGECEPMSLLGALMTCASLGLEPNTVLGHAYLIPFFNGRKKVTEIQLVVGYKGYIDMARRSGQIVSMHADVVYSDDELWEFEYGSHTRLRHKPGPRKGTKTHAYCHVKLQDGEGFVVLPWAEIMATRDRSQGWQTAVRFGKTAESPWTVHEDRMACKTAVRRMSNSGEMPLSVEFQTAMEVDERPADFGAFAFDPSAGAPTINIEPETPEADVVDPETGEVAPAAIEQKRVVPMEPVRQRETAPAAAAKPAAKAEAKVAPAADASDDLPPEIASVVERIEADLLEAAQGGAGADAVEMWSEQIALIGAHPVAKSRIDAAVAAAKGGAQ